MRASILLGVLLLFLVFLRSYLFFGQLPEYKDQQDVALSGMVASIPDQAPRSLRFVAQSDEGVRLYITTSSSSEYFYGQRMRIVGRVKEVVLDSGKTILTVSFPRIAPIRRSGALGFLVDGFYRMTHTMRSHVTGFYERYLPQNSAAFLSGVVLGVDNGMTDDYRDNLVNLGVVHVVAASGMNVTIVASLFFSIFSAFLHRKTAVLVSIVAIAFYIVLAGGQASIVRAGIMGSIAFTAGLVGRQYYGVLALFFTAFIMLLLSPFYIVDIGFQLSFLSTFGLLVLPRLFEGVKDSISGRLKVVGFLKEDFLVTFSAQLATLPVLFYHFGSYNVLSLVVNLLVLWVIPPLMILGGLSGVLSFVVPFVAEGIIFLCLPFLFYFEWVIGVFSPLKTVVSVSIPIVFVVAYYFLLGGVLLLRFSRKKT
jgi:competence protein ComEC